MNAWDLAEAGITYHPGPASVTIPLRLASKVVGWLVPGRIAHLLDHYRAQLAGYRPMLGGSPPALRLGADARHGMAKRVAQTGSRLDQSRGRIVRIWQGRAARSCDRALTRLGPKLDGIERDLTNQANALDSAAKGQESAQARLNHVLARFETGAASIMKAAQSVSSSLLGQPVEITALVRRAGELFLAAVAWAEAIKRELGSLFTNLAASLLAGGALGQIPAPGTDPTQVAVWWKGLTGEQQQAYVQIYPERIGGLDGIPAAHRDTANRELLRRYLENPPSQDQGHPRHQAVQNLYDKLKDQQGQLFLLKFDPQGDGRAAVAVGNPDTAAHTAVAVPGVGNTIADMSYGMLERASVIKDEASRFNNGSVSVIAWIDYDPPGRIEAHPSQYLEAANDSVGQAKAVDGAIRLNGFVEGLRATHSGSMHLSVIGHSYGSVVAGIAASSGRLGADDLAVVGSPGIGVDHAAQLGKPNHVWVGAHDSDPIANPESVLPGSYQAIDGIHSGKPHDPRFGANVFNVGQADPGGAFAAHSEYWDPNEKSAQNLGAIVAGAYSKVDTTSGAKPANDLK